MKVLMTTDTVGGVWTYALQLASSLADAGIHFHLATSGAPLSQVQRTSAAALPNVTLHESTFRLEWMEEPWQDVRAAGDWLLQLAARLQPDVIHLNDYSHGSLPWPAPVLMVGHSCVLSWHEAVRGAPTGPEWEPYRLSVTKGLRSANVVVAPTEAMLERLEYFYGPLKSTAVIANGRDALRSPGDDRKLMERARGCIMTAGRAWDDAKNLRLLSDAAPQIDAPIRVAGTTQHPAGYNTHLPGLQWLGQLDSATLATHFRDSGIYAHPARYEPFGLAPLEAAGCGCALVLADIRSLREVWGPAALYASPHSPRQWAALLNALLQDGALRERYARLAKARAVRYSAARMAARYHQLYQDLTSRPAEVRPPTHLRESQDARTP